jgi:ABC-type glycerol-3-phosphate transport system substrate-binding protein
MVLLLCAVSVFALTGCSSGGGSSTKPITTIYWWRSTDDAPEATLKAIVSAYNANSATSRVKVEVVLKDSRTYEQEVLDALAANQSVTNAPDVISVNGQDLPRFVPQLTPAADNLFDSKMSKANKLSKSSDEYVAMLYEPSVAKTVLFKDSAGKTKVFGLPIGVDNLALYINTSLINKAVESLTTSNTQTKDLSKDEIKILTKKLQTPPQTWTDLVQMVPYLTVKNGSDISSSAIALGSAGNVERAYDILQTLMMQTQTQMTNDNLDTATFNQSQSGAASSSSPGEAALKFFLRFSNPNDPLYTWNDKMPNDVNAFMQGQLAMMVHYEDVYRFMISETPSIKQSTTVVALPQISNPSSPTSANTLKTTAKMRVEAAVSAKGDATKQAAAWDFIQWLTSKNGSSNYLSAMKISSALKEITSKSKFKAIDTQKTFADVWYKGHKAQQVDEIFLSLIDDTASGRKTPKDALDKAASDTTTILQASKSKWAVTSGGD